MNKEDRNSFRKEMLGKIEEHWAKSNSPEDALFYYHPSEDKLFLHIRCLNKDCTGNGFYLMDEIERAIYLRQVVIGEKKCDRKEDCKYLESSGCSCLTTLKYTITPIFK